MTSRPARLRPAPLSGGARLTWVMLAGLIATVMTSSALATPDASELFLPCPDGVPTQDLQGRAIPADFWRTPRMIVVFWSLDCAFCRRHNERLSSLLVEEPTAAVLGIAVDGTDASVRQLTLRRGYRFPVVREEQGRCALRSQLTDHRLVPMTCWLGDIPHGPRCIPGEMSSDDLRALLRQAARP